MVGDVVQAVPQAQAAQLRVEFQALWHVTVLQRLSKEMEQ
jgi:hypothetical protein